MLAAAAKNPNTKEAAAVLQARQIKGWLSYNLDPDDIFKLMKLDQASNNLFDNPTLTAWTNYLAAFNKKNPRKETTSLQGFTKSYGEEGFLKILASADDSVGTTKCKEELAKGWLDEPTHPANIFKFLKLDEAGDDLLTNPLLSTWALYVQEFNKKYPFAKATMIQTFSKSYSEEKVAVMIQAATKNPETEKFAKDRQTAQFKQWMVDEKTPDDVFKKVLMLDSTDSPNADIWRSYYSAYDKEYTGKLLSFKP